MVHTATHSSMISPNIAHISRTNATELLYSQYSKSKISTAVVHSFQNFLIIHRTSLVTSLIIENPVILESAKSPSSKSGSSLAIIQTSPCLLARCVSPIPTKIERYDHPTLRETLNSQMKSLMTRIHTTPCCQAAVAGYIVHPHNSSWKAGSSKA